MPVQLPPPEVLEQIEELIASSTPAKPRQANLAPAADVDGEIFLPYRGRVHRIAPTSVSDGLNLHRLRGIVGDLSEVEASGGRLSLEQLADLEEAYVAQTRLFHQLIRTRWLRRPWLNPFRKASAAEIEILGKFFLGCRMRTRFKGR